MACRLQVLGSWQVLEDWFIVCGIGFESPVPAKSCAVGLHFLSGEHPAHAATALAERTSQGTEQWSAHCARAAASVSAMADTIFESRVFSLESLK